MKTIDIKLKLVIVLLVAIVMNACSKDDSPDKDGATNEYEISFQMSFGEDIYVIYTEYIHDDKKSFQRYEDSDDNSAYLEDSKTYTANNKIGVSFESYATVPTKSIDVKIVNLGSGKTVLNENVGNISYDYPNKSKVTIIYDIESKKTEVVHSD